MLISNTLTFIYTAFIVFLPLTHLKDGSRRPNVGHKRPLSNVVFLYPSKTQVFICLVLFVLVGCILEPFKRFAPAYGGTSNLIQSTAQQLDVVSGGYLLHIGDITMPQSNSAQHPDQKIKIDNLHASFQQLCFAYGALAFDKNRFNQEKYKWFAEDCKALADSALEIHRLKAGV